MNCHECKHMGTNPGDCHIQCRHPAISDSDRLIARMLLMQGRQDAGVMKRLNISADKTGIRNGWFFWPLNFDPTWLKTCDGFERKGGEHHETSTE